MNKNQKILVSLGVALSLVVSIWAFNHKQVVVQKPDGTTQPIVGSIASPYFQVGGTTLYGGGESLRTGTSTVCVIQSPAATSTLITAGVNFQLASTSVVLVDLAKATTVYATSTSIGTAYGVATSSQATIVASSTGSVAGDATIFAPNTFFMVKYSGYNSDAGTGNASKGSCWALWARN